MDKRWMYEEAFRMPLIMHWPNGITACPSTESGQAQQTNDWLINNTDFAPTLLEIAGASRPEYMQGKSFATALSDAPKPDDWLKFTYYRYWMHLAHNLEVPAHFGVRSERYKLIFFYGLDFNNSGRPPTPQTPAAWEFYDLKTDPQEMNNRYGDPNYKAIIVEMKLQLLALRADLDETDTAYPEIQLIIDRHWSQ